MEIKTVLECRKIFNMQIETWLIVVNCGKSEINLDLKKINFTALTNSYRNCFWILLRLCHSFVLCSCVCLLGRNGLGPSKEGEAQYSVVHCTGYIKAWPPAGRQTPNWYSCVYHCLTQTLPHGRTPLPHVVCVAWPNLKQLLIQQGFDSDTDAIPDPLQCMRACWQSNSFVFIYYSNSLCQCMRLSDWMCLGCIVSPNDVCFHWTEQEPRTCSSHFGKLRK